MPNRSARPPGFGSGALPVLGVSPTQSASAASGSASAAAATSASASALVALRDRVLRADLRVLGRPVGGAGGAAEGEDAHPLRACVDLASRLGSNTHDGVRIDVDAL